MHSQPNVAPAAALMADPARAAILMALIDGRARPAGELAYAAGVTAQTASSHLAKLLGGGLLAVETEGRHRYFRLASTEVALALENLAALGPAEAIRHKPLTRGARELRFARCCYDHLAGRVGVAVACGLQERGFLVAAADKRFEVTPAGMGWFTRLGLDVAKIRPGRRGLARQCLDWTERQHHLAGPLGVHFLGLMCTRGWLRRSSGSRAIHVTPQGTSELKQQLGIDLGAIELAN